MSVKTFAAIYVGSYEVSLKLFEISEKKKVRCIDFLRSRVELGRDAFYGKKLGVERMDDLCERLLTFRKVCDSYHVDDCAAYAGPALYQAANYLFVLDQIQKRTGFRLLLLSNSEHRFLSYQCATARPEFNRMIEERAAFVNVGGGELQITLFVHGDVLTTQHLVLGTMRLTQLFSGERLRPEHIRKQMKELIDKELSVFQAQYHQKGSIKYLILTGDYSSELLHCMDKNLDNCTVDAAKLSKYLKHLEKMDNEQIAEELNLSNESDRLLTASVILYRRIIEALSADSVWVPGIDISDGIVYDYALRNRYLKPAHDFDQDVLSAAHALSMRYMSYSPHIDALAEMSTLIYDATKKIHGLSKHERLLLQTAALLHDCGKYISFANAPQCAYDIILASEILGLSHKDRVIVASIVKYNTYPLVPYEQLDDALDKESYLIVAKCAAILRVANAMDRSHKQKFKNVRVTLKGKQLVIAVETADGLMLERTMFDTKACMFEDVFSIRPVVKEKRIFDVSE